MRHAEVEEDSENSRAPVSPVDDLLSILCFIISALERNRRETNSMFSHSLVGSRVLGATLLLYTLFASMKL